MMEENKNMQEISDNDLENVSGGFEEVIIKAIKFKKGDTFDHGNSRYVVCRDSGTLLDHDRIMVEWYMYKSFIEEYIFERVEPIKVGLLKTYNYRGNNILNSQKKK